MAEEADRTGPESEGASDSIELSEEVIATIACKETADIDGIVSLEGTFSEEVLSLLHRGKRPKGVRIEMGGGEVAISLTISVRYGVNIPELAKTIRERISDSIKTMTGLRVRGVHIQVESIEIPKEEKPEPALAIEEAG